MSSSLRTMEMRMACLHVRAHVAFKVGVGNRRAWIKKA